MTKLGSLENRHVMSWNAGLEKGRPARKDTGEERPMTPLGLAGICILLEKNCRQSLIIFEQGRHIANRKFAGVPGIEKTLNWRLKFRDGATTRSTLRLGW